MTYTLAEARAIIDAAASAIYGDLSGQYGDFGYPEDAARLAVAAALPGLLAGLRGIHKRMPIYDVMAHECDEHDYETFGVELTCGEVVCAHTSHEDRYTCAECAELAEDGQDGYPSWPCPTVRELDRLTETYGGNDHG